METEKQTQNQIVSKKEAINHKYNIREVFYIKTNEWFKAIQFPNKESAERFLKKHTQNHTHKNVGGKK